MEIGAQRGVLHFLILILKLTYSITLSKIIKKNFNNITANVSEHDLATRTA